jgi:hypothetical protein
MRQHHFCVWIQYKIESQKTCNAVCWGTYEAEGLVRDAFVLQRHQTKGDRTRTVFINQSLKNTLDQYKVQLINSEPSMPLFTPVRREAISAPTQCANCF